MQSVDGDRVHHCPGCKMNVYNLSAMTQSEAEGLLRKHEGRLCVRYYQRRDGTVMTRNCPVGAHAARLLLIRGSLAAAALFAFSAMAMLPFATMGQRASSTDEATMGGPAVSTQERPIMSEPIMGDVAVPLVETPAPAAEPTMGKAVIPLKKSDDTVQGRVAPRIEVTDFLTDHRNDIPDVPITGFEEKPTQH
jgi:hypothetical protein